MQEAGPHYTAGGRVVVGVDGGSVVDVGVVDWHPIVWTIVLLLLYADMSWRPSWSYGVHG